MIVPIKVRCEECDNTECVIQRYCHVEWKTLLSQYRQDFEFEAGEVIFRENQEVNGIYIIFSGRVKIITSLGNKQTRIIRFAGPNDVLGHRGFGGKEYYPISAIALTNVHLTYIPKDNFIRLLQMNNELCFWFMNFYANELKISEKRSAKLFYLPVLNRLAMALLMVADAFGYQPDTPGLLSFTPTRSELADIAGTTYESLIRALKEMEKNKWIKLVKKKIIILEEQILHELVDDKNETES